MLSEIKFFAASAVAVARCRATPGSRPDAAPRAIERAASD
jgi:hypothetical protein